MTSIFGFLKTLWAGEARRLQALHAEGCVIEVDQLGEDDEVVEVALGFGPEFWRVRPGYTIIPARALIEGGQLVVVDGKPLTDRSRLAFLRLPVVQLRYKT